jgi:4'-phosphopantetheinyl transferase
LKIPPLAFEGVQVWRLELGAAGAADRFSRLLSPDEKRRADAIRVLPVREEFVAGRGLLRLLLGAAVGVAPGSIVLRTEQNGKPCLAQSANVEFNVSHSEGMILIALSRASVVGVDVEFVSGEFGEAEELIGIARESFHAGEITSIARTPPGRERLLAFYRAWTRREAVAKADGRGIASLLKYEVFRADEFGEARVSLAGAVGSAEDGGDIDYFVQTPEAGPSHLAAVASRKRRQALAHYDARLLRV